MRRHSTIRELIPMRHRLRSTTRFALAAGAALVAVAACGNPLEVETTSRIPAENIEVPANAQLLVSGAVADFECAFASYVVQGATAGE
jgi:hypothetical protein